MNVQVNSDRKIEGSQAQNTWATEVVQGAIAHRSAHVTHVEPHLNVAEGAKGAPREVCCMIEARLEARQPVAVTQHGPALDPAVRQAPQKLARLVEHTLARRG